MICFPQKATVFLFKSPVFFNIYILMYIYHQRKKKRTHSPLTTLKIYKVETPCCWEMRIEKGEKTREKVQVFPPKCLLNKSAESKRLHRFDLISLFISPSLQSILRRVIHHFLFFKSLLGL